MGRRSLGVASALLAMVAALVLPAYPAAAGPAPQLAAPLRAASAPGVLRAQASGRAALYAFIATYLSNGARTPVRWPACRAIVFLVETTRAPAGASAAVRQAARELAAATGLTVTVRFTVRIGAGDLGAGVVPVRWPKSSSRVCDSAEAVACTGLSTLSSSGLIGATWISSARVSLYPDRSGGVLLQVLLHEFGHVVGLAHVSSKQQIMYASVGLATGYGPGDLAGLRIAGRGVCPPLADGD